MKARICHSLVVSSLISVGSVAAADSVNSWGPWEGVRTAAGPTGGVPLMLQYANANNLSDFETISVEEAGVVKSDLVKPGYRQYARFLGHKSEVKIVSGRSPQFSYVRKGLGSVKFAVPFIYNKSRLQQVIGTDVVLDRYDYPISPAILELSRSAFAHRFGYWYDHFDGGAFADGFASPISAIDSLASDVLAGNVTGYYFGEFLNDRGSVHLKLSFGGSPSWEGNFSHQSYNSFGGAGTIEGSELVGQARGNGITGSIEASIVGADAGSIIGMVDVVNDRGSLVDVFHTTPASPGQVAEQYSGEFESYAPEGGVGFN